MKYVSTREFQIEPAAVWQRLHEEKDLVITSNGKPVGVLTFADEDSLQEVLTTLRQGRALSATASINRRATEKGLGRLSDHHIETIVKRTRRRRRKGMIRGKR